MLVGLFKLILKRNRQRRFARAGATVNKITLDILFFPERSLMRCRLPADRAVQDTDPDRQRKDLGSICIAL